MKDLDDWLRERKLLPKKKLCKEEDEEEDEEDEEDEEEKRMIFVTCGSWDLKHALPRNCSLLGLACPEYMGEGQWINIKELYQQFYQKKKKPAGMTNMLGELGIELEGHHHVGLDDARNIAKVLRQMLRDGCVVPQPD